MYALQVLTALIGYILSPTGSYTVLLCYNIDLTHDFVFNQF